MNGQTLWSFETENFTVRLVAYPEQADPADSFELEEDIEAVRNGDVEWFAACVEVLDKYGNQLGADYLGTCAYRTFEEFYTSHRDPDPMNRNSSIMRASHPAGPSVSVCHYFPDMVRIAIAEARKNYHRPRPYLRRPDLGEAA